jgi:hypothetical protein
VAKEIIRGDRRLQRRYPLKLDLEFKIMDGDKVLSSGAGKTENLSSGGVLFHPAGSVPGGSQVELLVRWPAVLVNEPALDLHIFGNLVRNDPQGIAMHTSRYHFEKLENPQEAFAQLFTEAVIQ